MTALDPDVGVLPKARTGRRVQWLASRPTWLVALCGLGLYLCVVTAFSILEWSIATPQHSWVQNSRGEPIQGWWDLVYFNFISILTIGYGDLSPASAGRAATVLEALLGTGVLGLTLAAVTAKLLSPPEDAIAFSRYAYYCTEDEAFLVIYLNTTHNRLVNAEIASYFKLGADWGVKPPVRAPFVTRAVQTFFVDRVPEQEIIKRLNVDSDALRFGLDGHLAGTAVSVAIEYKPSSILVIPNRRELVDYRGFWDPDLSSSEFERMFNYQPTGALSLDKYVSSRRTPSPTVVAPAGQSSSGPPVA